MLKVFRQYVFFLCFLLVASGLVNANPDIQYFEKSGIVQRISWEAGKDVLEYELRIEKRDDTPGSDGFTRVLSRVTGETSVEF